MENRLVFEKKELKKYDSKVLGISGENEQEMLIFLFEDGFVDGICYLELEFPSGRKYSIETEKDEKNECYKLEVKNSLLKKDGLIRMQLKIVNKTAVWKSIDFEMHVLEAINAVESMEEDYPSFVELTKIRMQEIETGFSQLDEKVNSLNVPSEEEREVWNNKSDFSGDYEDLKNKPEIPSIEGLASENFVREKINEIEIPSVEGLATIEYVDNVVGNVDSLLFNIAEESEVI